MLGKKLNDVALGGQTPPMCIDTPSGSAPKLACLTGPVMAAGASSSDGI